MEIIDTRKMWETELVIVSTSGVGTFFFPDHIFHKVRRK